ncbi:3-oxoadipate enol-lactonase [Gordonia neofelifaecis]|uniref:3-oxoadipate enol-lactonase n=1 Tax=Gordonia neofelifaecis NRRL B-59395 TaxID=644548 RepID=F1YPM5_9ACTN|nr:3-oxoadipate enol-lactonase [Gordonia neofelifaecis]EGD53370.1 3-oxoadipate enol-lactonase [Gordonia neofelifaecis NRRL B-59395]
MSAVDVHAVVTGRSDGPAVVLSNSLGSTHRMWDAQIADLEQHFMVVRYDTRGHGLSPVPDGPYSMDDLADDVLAVLDGLGIERAHFVGLSLGGMTGMRLAVRDPARVNRLALLCTGAKLDNAASYAERAVAVRADGVASVAEAVVGRWFTPEYLAADADRRHYYETMVASTPAEGYAGCCEAIAAMDQRADLPRITAPTLAVAGADDTATGPSTLAEIAGGVRHGRLLVVPDAAHLAPAQQPEVVNPALIEHLLAE